MRYFGGVAGGNVVPMLESYLPENANSGRTRTSNSSGFDRARTASALDRFLSTSPLMGANWRHPIRMFSAAADQSQELARSLRDVAHRLKKPRFEFLLMPCAARRCSWWQEQLGCFNPA